MSKIGLVFVLIFGVVATFLSFTKDGQILLSFLVWPSSILVGLLCAVIGNLCYESLFSLSLIIIFGLIQYYLFGLILEFFIEHIKAKGDE